ncbi:beta-1,4-xylanase [Xanthomonas oryzae pv. oryzicola]|nr:beta-1,4-xylanase [Xanthomonas oryzae pv. oryzicola]KOR44736.1 beta-1,4-xylanase [Xanthomonas oryzae]OLK91475.1 beta-1,4-xylanase [Xanthomonas oryzae pv. oryzicola]
MARSRRLGLRSTGTSSPGKWRQMGQCGSDARPDDWSTLDAAYRFAQANGMPFQMHVMMWGNQQPEWIKSLRAVEQRREIARWFATVAQRYPDIALLEVVNEPLNDPPSKADTGGGNYLQAFRLARQHVPHTKRMINDYSITNSAQATQKYLQILRLLQREHLLDAIGVQKRAFETTPNVAMSVHRDNLDALAATCLPIYITEFDLDGPTDTQQLADYQRVFPLFWERPAMHGITLWGFRPGMWRDKEAAYLIRADGTERPALTWLRDYVAAHPGTPTP